MTPALAFHLFIVFIAACAVMSVVFLVLALAHLVELFISKTTKQRKAEIATLLFAYFLFPVQLIINLILVDTIGDGSSTASSVFYFTVMIVPYFQLAAFALLIYLRSRARGYLSAIRAASPVIIPIVYLTVRPN